VKEKFLDVFFGFLNLIGKGYKAFMAKFRLLPKVWQFFLGFVFYFWLYTRLVSMNFLWLFGSMPDLEKLENPKQVIASELYSADGVLLGKYFRENRSPVAYEDINPIMVKALIATEDVRFYEHSGIDLNSLISIPIYLLKGDNRGGSTLTQQLAKNLFKTRNDASKGVLGYVPLLNTMIIKTKEWIMATRLEKTFTKEEILTMYLNTVDFGSNSFGIKVACSTFFACSPKELGIAQAATLVGLLKAPTSYSPVLNPEKSLERRNVVLGQLLKYQIITETAFDSLSTLPLVVNYKQETQNDGSGTYFRSVVGNYLRDWCKKNGLDLYADGLKIYTTLNSRIQAHAEAAVDSQMKVLQDKFYKHWKGKNPWVDDKDNEIPGFIEKVAKRTDYYIYLKKKYEGDKDSIEFHMNRKRKMRVFAWRGDRDTILSPIDSIRYYKHFLQCGMMTMDPFSGQILAWVGGINFKYFKYDHVYQSKRQPGSTFKPFVYCAAIDKGMSPCDKMIDQRVFINYYDRWLKKDTVWSPRNSDWVFTGEEMTLRRAMAKSVNSITAQLVQKIGAQAVIEYAHKLGIQSRLDTIPSVGLGSSDVSLYEMIGAYSTFLNKGVWTEPIFVTRIEDKNGNLIHEFVPQRKHAISEETAWLMLHMLKGGLEEPGGTSQALFQHGGLFKGNEFGGKTGTSSNHSDGWFMGVTKNLVSGVWVGGDDRSIHFRTSALGEGARTACPVYGIYMEKLYEDKETGVKMGYFPTPFVKITKPYNCRTKLKPKVDSTSIPVDSLGVLPIETP
jgi:penicillin-binding protein 1A